MKLRTVIFLIICSALWLGETAVDSNLQPRISTQLAINAMNGGNADAANLRASNQVWSSAEMEFAGLTLIAALFCYGSVLTRALGSKGK